MRRRTPSASNSREILGALADADVADRQPQLARDREYDAALRGAVELGHHDAGHAERLVELARLLERVLSLARVEHQQHFVRRALVDPAHHALHLLQFVHQVRLRVQATCGVGEQDVDAPRAGCLQRVEHDRSGICAGGLRDHGHVVAIAPDLQLLDGGGAERVARGEHDFEALLLQLPRELADGRGLAGAVDADDENRERRSGAVDLQWLLRRPQDVQQRAAQRCEQCFEIVELLALDLATQLFEDALRGFDANVRGDQSRLELVENRVVDAACRQQVGEVVGQPRVAAVELLAQPLEQAGPRRLLSGLSSVFDLNPNIAGADHTGS